MATLFVDGCACCCRMYVSTVTKRPDFRKARITRRGERESERGGWCAVRMIMMMMRAREAQRVLTLRCRFASPHPTTTNNNNNNARLARPSVPLACYAAALLCTPSYCTAAAEVIGSEGGLEEEEEEGGGPRDAGDVLRMWGCSESEVSQILWRHPSIRRMGLPLLQSKLEALRAVGLLGPHLARIINCRPRFLSVRIGDGLPARLAFLRTLFPPVDCGPSLLLLRAIVRNPSLLNYDVDATMRPCVRLYESLGVSRHDLGRLLVSRPTIIPRSSLDPDKLDLIRRTCLTPPSPMYKYAVSVVAVSRTETLRRKLANLEKFGFAADELMGLVARTPNVLTLSVDKVQRNMTFLIGTMRLPARLALDEPIFLYHNLEKVLRPRYLLGVKMQGMGLHPGILGPSLVTAMRMKEARFLKAFVTCHDKDVTQDLMEFYNSVKELKRLADSSRSVVRQGFPF